MADQYVFVGGDGTGTGEGYERSHQGTPKACLAGGLHRYVSSPGLSLTGYTPAEGGAAIDRIARRPTRLECG
ncbi:hypothetical protein GCM10027296_08330 [Chitinimonas naiadis]